ncbi:response regulator [Oscillatoria sp. FACHB-1406]|uniref:response regulator n=1 Tax=Oscillatoria sp. FACHB-1406 TaxID=2692846 RepID=UPI0016845687|nr:response regulator [Oscillatoria sp. FACHB-1406]MBD2576207.1 response regulator [Oscillatoria sp. FACHB-1406]
MLRLLLHFPRLDGESMDLTTVEHSVREIGMTAPTILAVDDHEDCLILLVNILELMGCTCIAAGTAKEALSKIGSCPLDLILLDIVLPDMNGLELLARVRKKYPGNKVPAIAVTGLVSRQERARIQKAGFDDYLCKPYSIGDLECLLHRHLDGKLTAGPSLNGKAQWF